MYTFHCAIDPELADQLEDYFCEWIRSPWSLVRQPTERNYVLYGYFFSEKEASENWHQLRAQFIELPREVDFQVLHDREWKDAYKQHLKYRKLCDLHWVPAWDKAKVKIPTDEYVVYLDSGMAFGTGSHESTRLCANRLLDFRERYADTCQSAAVIDVGCGSGILSISAAALGFKNVFGFDSDPEAVRVSIENSTINGVDDCVEYSLAGIEEGLDLKPRADLILANLQANLLCIYAQNFLWTLKVNGMLAMSGILTTEVEEVKTIFEGLMKKESMKFDVDSRDLGEWADLCYRRL